MQLCKPGFMDGCSKGCLQAAAPQQEGQISLTIVQVTLTS